MSLIVDNGPDWSTSSLTNCLYFFRLFVKLDLDVLFVASFCPKFSAFNPIEHSWAVCTRALTAVTLSAILPGDTAPPCLQKLSDEAKRQKETVVFDRAMKQLCTIWQGFCYANRQISAFYQPCLQKSHPFNDHADIKVKNRTTTSLANNHELLDELKLMMKHLDRRIDFICVKKCPPTEV